MKSSSVFLIILLINAKHDMLIAAVPFCFMENYVIKERRDDTGYFTTASAESVRKKQPDDTSYMMIYRENKILVREGETLAFLTYRELREICETAGEMAPQSIYLFSLGEETYFLTELPEHLTPEGYCFEKMFAVRSGKPKEHILAAATAWHLYEWYRDNRFCGRCGQKLMHNGTLRMLFCPACGNQVFPKIAPAVIVGVTDGEYILMTTYANREYKRYALIAGFTEIGETAEETVMREVQEEVGLKVKNIHYYKSQPWGFDQNLLLGYFCELDGERDIVLDTGELATAEWVHYSDVPEDPEGLSLTREMMSVFQKNFTSEKMS